MADFDLLGIISSLSSALGSSSSTTPQVPSTTPQVPSKTPASSSIWDSIGSVVGSKDFLNAALNSGVSLAGQVMQNKNEKQIREEDKKAAAQELALKAKYGLLGGGGGGGNSLANLIDAYKTAIYSNNIAAEGKHSALTGLMNATQNAYLRK